MVAVWPGLPISIGGWPAMIRVSRKWYPIESPHGPWMTMAILWGLLYWHEKKLTRRHGSVMRSCAWQASRPVDALAKEVGVMENSNGFSNMGIWLCLKMGYTRYTLRLRPFNGENDDWPINHQIRRLPIFRQSQMYWDSLFKTLRVLEFRDVFTYIWDSTI